ncbi:hypothetical protein J5J86_21540 [Aquabacter sp. L1I39]|uniref:hypothetical protein n=1 Tax=Aquabacter sp. L1I39 TaxID=2820278 RepID=UPI001ADD2CE6|nr:hypothetical protein [Aquabacter sp. L1I39]QTL03295.1 hypothetical protein J5J86_21540 [Aquabacter sp. L1I39]
MSHPAVAAAVPAAPDPADVRALAWGMVVLAATFIFARTPHILMDGRLFAEEGVIYFRDAVAGSWWDALLAPRVGYYSAFNKLAALAASVVPLEGAARVTTWCALAVQLSVVWIVARSDAFGPLWGRALAALVPIVAVPSAEVWLNTINSQFHLAVGTAVLLATGRAALPSAVRLAFLLLAGATGPVSVALAPLFALKALRSRTGQDMREAALLCALALVQAVLMIRVLAEGERGGGLSVLAMLSAIGVKNLALPWLGDAAGEVGAVLLAGSRLAKALAAAGLAAFAALLAVTVLRTPASRWLAAAALLVALVSYAGALGKDPWILLIPAAAGRYAYAPNALMGLALIAAMAGMAERRRAWRPLRPVAGVLALWMLACGFFQYWNVEPFFSGPSWRAEVTAWRADPARERLALWPPPWFLPLPHPAPAAPPR